MFRPTLHLPCIAWLALLAISAAEESAWAPAEVVEGVPYQTAEELRSFYKLALGGSGRTTRKGAYTVSNTDTSIELGPGKRELRIGGVRLELSQPLHRDAAGNMLLSREDWVKWIDPIMRPTYIADRQAVQMVVIDPGHGGHDAGTPSPYVTEMDATLQVALKLKDELEKQGCKVVLTRSGDYFLSDQQRVDIANAGDHAVFLSLHLNSGRSDFRGAEVYTVSPPEQGEVPRPGNTRDGAHAALAYAVQQALIAHAGAADGGCHRAHFSLLSSITCPAIWVELGYATHAQEGPSLATEAYQTRLAQALAQGIAAYAHVANPATAIPVQPPAPKASTTKPKSTSKASTTSSGSKKRTSGSSSSSSSRSSSSSGQRSRSGSTRRSR